MIKLEKEIIKVKIKNPLLNFKIDEQKVELRKDPLTKRVTRVNVNRIRRVHQGVLNEAFLRKAVKISKKKCFFCEENLEKLTPQFVEFGRLRFGESFLFPNLFPYSQNHAVVIFSSKKHFIPLNKLTPRILFNSLMNALNYFKTFEKNLFPTISLNYLPPAGASIVHPHLQVFIEERPTSSLSLLMEKSLSYYKEYGTNFWEDLVKEEIRRKERFIGRTKYFSWISDFAPIKNFQVSCIGKKSSLLQLKEKEMLDLSVGLSKIFGKLWKNGVRSINLTTFSGPSKEDISQYFLLSLKIVARPSPSKGYTSDIGFLELFQGESAVETLPEEVARMLKFK